MNFGIFQFFSLIEYLPELAVDVGVLILSTLTLSGASCSVSESATFRPFTSHRQTPKRNKPKILGKLLAFTMHESGDRKFLFWGDFKWVVSQDNTLGLVCGDSDVTEAGGETNSCNEFAYFCLPSERTLP